MNALLRRTVELQMLAACVALVIAESPGAIGIVARDALFGGPALVWGAVAILAATIAWCLRPGRWLAVVDVAASFVVAGCLGRLLRPPIVPGDEIAVVDTVGGAGLVVLLLASLALPALGLLKSDLQAMGRPSVRDGDR